MGWDQVWVRVTVPREWIKVRVHKKSILDRSRVLHHWLGICSSGVARKSGLHQLCFQCRPKVWWPWRDIAKLITNMCTHVCNVVKQFANMWALVCDVAKIYREYVRLRMQCRETICEYVRTRMRLFVNFIAYVCRIPFNKIPNKLGSCSSYSGIETYK